MIRASLEMVRFSLLLWRNASGSERGRGEAQPFEIANLALK
jgi:hypothetical protein